MKKSLAWLIVIFLVALSAGAFVYKAHFAPPQASVADQSYQVSFICDDGTHFIAHFTNRNTVEIDVDGTIVQELNQASTTSGYYYQNDGWDLHLNGETATVSRVSDGQSGTCHQPFDPNLAPYNWGD